MVQSRFLLLMLTLTGLLPLAAAADGPADGYRLEMLDQVDASAFPEVTVRFRILDAAGQPARELPNADILILEDGREVARIRPARLKSLPVAAMLVLDTSGSMEREDKLAQAKAAAMRFIHRLEPEAACGAVLFHHRPNQTEPPSLDRPRLEEKIGAAAARGGTACFDAVLAALEQFPQGETEQQQAVVLMTDGRDVNSSHSLAQVLSAARARKTPIFVVGLGQPGRAAFVRTALVLDRSGSMQADQRLVNLRKAASRFIQLMPQEAADTAVIAFNDRIAYALEERGFSSDKQRLNAAIESLRAGGETRLYDAIHEALTALAASRANWDDDRPLRMAVIALTDGMDNRSTQYRYDLDVIPAAKRLGIPVHLLGLGPKHDLNENVMREIASSTGGQYHYIRDASLLTEVFEELSIDLHDGGIDEVSLRTLARETGGEYFHVAEAEKLGAVFEQLAAKVQHTYAVTFQSARAQADGTGRNVQVRLGDLVEAVAGYKTHGMITPRSDPALYLGALCVLLFLLILPTFFRRRPALEPV